MIDYLAPKWGGLLVFPEERYYGKSLPFGGRQHFLTFTERFQAASVDIQFARIKADGNLCGCGWGAAGDSFLAKNMVYLTTEQILEDYVELIDHLKATLPSAAACPVPAGAHFVALTTFSRNLWPCARIRRSTRVPRGLGC